MAGEGRQLQRGLLKTVLTVLLRKGLLSTVLLRMLLLRMVLLGILLAGLVSQTPLAAAPTTMAPPQASAPRPQEAGEVRDSGSFHRAKVRILGIPVLTVASPVVTGSAGPDARQRAQVIEGNLELLYRAQEVCTEAESLGEFILDQFFLRSGKRTCDSNQLGLLGDPGGLKVEVAAGSGGPPVLQARVPGRDLPLPLLIVTDDDARLNGTTPQRLAERWRPLLEQRLRFARHLLETGVLRRRFRTMAVLELVLGCLLFAGLGLWSLVKRQLGRLELQETLALAASQPGSPPAPASAVLAANPAGLSDRTAQGHAGAAGVPTTASGAKGPPLAASGPRHSFATADHHHRKRNLLIPALHLLSRTLLAAVLLLLPLMVGVAVLAVPGQIPLAIDLLLQPFGVVGKLLLGWLLAQLLLAVLAALLSQWNGNPSLTPERRARRNQRYRSLQRVAKRLVHLACIALVALWVLVDIPGVRDLSSHALIASGALLGALALVFQDLLRDVVAGLTVLLEDRYAIGDQITVGDLSGEVIDVALLSTELRSPDQRVIVMPNSQCKQVVNATKLRSGQELRLTLAHGSADPRRALTVIEQAASALAADPAWGAELLEPPRLLGLRQVSPEGLEVALLVVTRAGRQGGVERELLLRLVEALQAADIPLAERP
ncbi:MAG: mechanosensitive ion channel [Cyanobacteria bacterium]|nr:mechanosensitive ion channel [Cyanobacteriota bacterium]